MEPQRQFPYKVCGHTMLIGFVLSLATLSTGQVKPRQSPVYHDSDFGFTFSYPGTVKKFEITPIGYGRCIHMGTGTFAINACGAVFPECSIGNAKGMTGPHLNGAFVQWEQEEQTAGGLIQDTQFGDNWFVSQAIEAPNMLTSLMFPSGQVSIRKAFAGNCLINYMTIYVAPEETNRSWPTIRQIARSFRPGDMDAMPPLEKRRDWNPDDRSSHRTVPLP